MGKRSKTKPPSGSSRWLKCAGSVKLIEAMKWESKSSIYTEEGTLAHLIGETLLRLPKSEHKRYTDAIQGLNGKQAFGKTEWEFITVTKEMIDYVMIYVNFVLDLKGKTGNGNILYVEASLPLFYEPDAEGTADAIIVNTSSKHLHIVDLKYGKGIKVLIGSQLQIYAINAIAHYSWAVDFDLITMHIVQPRLDHIISETITIKDLVRLEQEIQQGVERTLAEKPEFNPGTEQCRFCPGKTEGTCKALTDYNLEIIKSDFEDLESETPLFGIELLTDEEVKLILDNADLIEGWLRDLKRTVYNKLLVNEEFPGYKLVEGNSRRKWYDEQRALTVLSDYFNTEDLLEERLLSPAKVDKLLKTNNLPYEVYERVYKEIEKPQGKAILVPESDSRDSINSVINDDFDVIE